VLLLAHIRFVTVLELDFVGFLCLSVWVLLILVYMKWVCFEFGEISRKVRGFTWASNGLCLLHPSLPLQVSDGSSFLHFWLRDYYCFKCCLCVIPLF